MANHMETYVKVRGLKQEGIDYLNELLTPPDGEYEVHTTILAERMYDVSDEQLTRDWAIEKFGAKWLYVDGHYIDGEEAEFNITSAWAVPTEFLAELVWRLNQKQGGTGVVINGKYIDESYDPCGVFCFAHQYDDVEDIFGSDDLDTDRLWEDEEYENNFHERLNAEVESMYEAYVEYLEESEEE